MGGLGAAVVIARRRGLAGLRALWPDPLPPIAPDAEALVRSDGRALSYQQLQQSVEQAASALRRAAVRSGRAVGVAIADPAGFLIAALAAWECGAAVLPLEPQAADGRAGASNLIARGQPVLIATAATLEGELTLEAAPVAGELDPRCALLLFTSGSSGPPKGVLLGRAGIAANVDAILRYLPLRPGHRAAIVLPLTYSYALVGQALAGLRAGATLLLLGDQRYPTLQLDTMAWLDAHGLSAVPSALQLLARARRESPQAPAPRLEYLASAGARLDEQTVALVRQAFPGARLFNQYGLTEASPRVAAVGDHHPAFARGAAGFPLEGIEIWIEDDDGARLAAGQSGAIVMRGPSVMLGYLDDPEASARVLSESGALRTGDLGFLDESGAVHVEGRSDGVVKVGGERVGLEAVAEELRRVPGVRDAAVVALPDESLGAKLFACLEGDASRETVRAAVRSLPPPQRPRLLFVAALPRTARGKIDLVELKQMALLAAQQPARPRAGESGETE